MVGSSLETVADLVAAIYRSAYEPSEWPGTIERIRLALNGARACLVRIGPDMRPDDVLATDSDPTFDRAFAQDARLHSNQFSRTVDRMPLGPVVLHGEIWETDSLVKSPLWNEYLSPQDIHSGLMAKIFATDTSYWFVGASRGRRHADFAAADRALMAVLAPHVRRATEIGRALEVERRSFDLRARIGGAVGLATVDSARRILAIDATADAILSRPGCPLRRQTGRLDACRGQAIGFADRVRQACRIAADPFHAGGGEMVARARPENEAAVDVLVSISPLLSPDRVAPFNEPGAIIAMRELSPALPTGFATTAAAAFCLTPKEGRISALLAAGRSLQDAAAAERIAIATARGHLAQIFRKTGTCQQSALVALLRTVEPLARSRSPRRPGGEPVD